ncbi:hypothetical protein F2P56_006455 [Juglans regia]|uniref:Zinc transporter 5-like n=1 Tax=Juglans regia TaxID=51240 RepID=A0A833Y122_JUGRE|nr:hypothetical protein F2P56_006455 [Juglans regia]
MIKFRRFSCKFLSITSLILLVGGPILVSSKCICESQEEDRKTSDALKYKLVAMASILVASSLGVCLPYLVKKTFLHPEKDIYFLIKAFAAGVILATGFIHVLPDAFESLTSPCIGGNPWGKFPFTGFVAMVSAIGTMMMEAFATGYQKRSELRKAQPVNADGESDGAHVHGPAFVSEISNSSDLIRHRIISQAKFKHRTVAIMILFFSLTTPAGIAVGIGISNVYKENSPTALIVQGLLLSGSAGILIYMALVDLLAADFMNPKMLTNFRLQIGANLTLLLGACFMSLLALGDS